MIKAMNRRTRTGLSSLLLCIIATFILLPLGLLTFEVWRFAVAKSQLQYVCDAAALAGIATLVPSTTAAAINAQQSKAIDAATYTAQKNSVLAADFQKVTTQVNAPPVTPVPAFALSLGISLLDSSQNIVALGTPGTKSLRVSAVYGYVPAFGKFLGLGTFPITAVSEGALPAIDLALCFDVSGSMDDSTPVSMVKRYWDGNGVSYFVQPAGQGILSNIVRPTELGSRVNAVGPENLSCFSLPGNGCPLTFSESSNSNVNGLRAFLNGAQWEIGKPPGNYDPANPSSPTGHGINPAAAPNAVTDIVVNLDGNTSFGGFTDSATGLQFPNVQTLVEAARGNLNSDASIRSAIGLNQSVKPSWLPQTAPNPQYQAVYFAQANKIVQPMMDAKTAASDVLHTVDDWTDLHAGLIAFSDYPGTTPTSTWGTQPSTNTYFVDSHWPAGGTGAFPLPNMALSATNPVPVATILQKMSTLVATGKSQMASALTVAQYQLTVAANARPAASKFILLVSDGEPDLPGSGGGASSAAAQAAYDAATACANNGIRIICIDVGTKGNTNHSAIMQQIADLSHGMYVAGNNPTQLEAACRTIADSLVTLK